MAVKTATQAMRRKAGAGRPAPEVGRMTPARAWTAAVPRAAENTLSVRISVLKVDEERVVRDALPDLVTEQALLTLLEGPEGRFGLAVLSAPVLSGLIEAATTGRINPRPVAPREPTRTDATICADLLDAILDGFDARLAEMEDAPNLAGYRYAAPLLDARAVTMTLAEGPYSVYRLTVDLGAGVRQGEFVAAFPVAPQGAAARRGDAAAFQRALADNVMESPVELDAALIRLQMRLSEVSDMRAGNILRIPLAALGAVGIEAPGGPILAKARLGQRGGFRALRVTHVKAASMAGDADAPDFEEAAPAPAALPPAGYGLGNLDGAEPLDGLSDADFPPMGEVELPGLPTDDAEGFPDIPGLPPLSG